MNPEAVRVIADRGHGLSKVQLDAMRWLAWQANGGHFPREGKPPRSRATWRALTRIGMVAYDFRSGTGGYHLTRDGQAVLARRRNGGEQR